MRSMFSVVTPMIWVSPRSNSAEPWTRGRMPTSAASGRMSTGERPSMRTPSVMTRLRTSFLVSERSAADSSPSRPSKSAPSFSSMTALTRSSSVPRSCLSAMVSAWSSSAATADSTAAYASSR